MSGVCDWVPGRMLGNVVHVQYSGMCDDGMSEGEPGVIVTVLFLVEKLISAQCYFWMFFLFDEFNLNSVTYFSLMYMQVL